jgi:serine/threonine protein kinase
MQKVCGTYAYLAPEIYSGKRYTEKSDIFSLGIGNDFIDVCFN